MEYDKILEDKLIEIIRVASTLVPTSENCPLEPLLEDLEEYCARIESSEK